ncbi:MarR family winged helix-turn-helix transcriptional regulator [Loigolactobacillus jiayinensis]|uniref:MarR family winged helix-turn-helix transcriptional regulator n=1 Tax=Loigolactobacillus jiayinensis TaxID=2486016 RepID=A0ABW1RIZ3_9LACO|nr:MarR family transcriptional regulator [Loigolactobacillus jiayinensis]
MDKDHNNSELLGQLFMTLAQVMTQNRFLEEFGLTRLQAIALRNVYKHPGITMTELAKTIGITRPQLTRIISILEERGLVRRQHNEENRRIVNVYRTEKGEAVVKQHMQLVQQRIQAQIDTLGVKDRETLSLSLQTSINLMVKANIIKADSIGDDH